jgi:hypothetical protein
VARIRAGVQALRAHPWAGDLALAATLSAVVLADVLTRNGGYLTGSRAVYLPAGLLMTMHSRGDGERLSLSFSS